MSNALQDVKLVSVKPPQVILDNASWTNTEIDTKGFDYAKVVFYLGATDIALTVLKVQDNDVAATSLADVTGLEFGDAGSLDIEGSASVLPSATNDNTFFVFDIDLHSRKRFLNLVSTIGDGTAGGYATAFCILSKADATLGTNAGAGATQVLRTT